MKFHHHERIVNVFVTCHVGLSFAIRNIFVPHMQVARGKWPATWSVRNMDNYFLRRKSHLKSNKSCNKKWIHHKHAGKINSIHSTIFGVCVLQLSLFIMKSAFYSCGDIHLRVISSSHCLMFTQLRVAPRYFRNYLNQVRKFWPGRDNVKSDKYPWVILTHALLTVNFGANGAH